MRVTKDCFCRLVSKLILDGFKLAPYTEVFIAFYREKEASLDTQDQR